MNKAFQLLAAVPWMDWLAVVVLLASWVGYAKFAVIRARTEHSILEATNTIRRQWMWQITYRSVRVVDGIVIQNLATSPSFFASTTILIIGGLMAVLGTDKANEVLSDLPFAARTTVLIFDMKLLLLLCIFVYAFFRFTWSMRQYTFGALLMASAPESDRFEAENLSRDEFADKAGRVVGLAAEAFNDGLRAYYFSFAALGWFLSPEAFVVATLGVVYILFQREFHSDVLSVLNS
jgi:uncharacterized membrane protein